MIEKPQSFMDGLNNIFRRSSIRTKTAQGISETAVKNQELVRVDKEISMVKECLYAAARKEAEPKDVISALLSLEKLMRRRNKLDAGKTSVETKAALNGSWRLIFTTGTTDTQNKIGKINYFPIKAIQTFSTESKRLSNGIFLGDFALLMFFGEWAWLEDRRKLEFGFDTLKLLNGAFTINLGKGEAEKLGSASGLGSSNNEVLVNKEKKAFFNWISADNNIATARGGGGGLALWRKEEIEGKAQF